MHAATVLEDCLVKRIERGMCQKIFSSDNSLYCLPFSHFIVRENLPMKDLSILITKLAMSWASYIIVFHCHCIWEEYLLVVSLVDKFPVHTELVIIALFTHQRVQLVSHLGCFETTFFSPNSHTDSARLCILLRKDSALRGYPLLAYERYIHSLTRLTVSWRLFALMVVTLLFTGSVWLLTLAK